MRRTGRVLVTVSGAAIALVALGFFVFASVATRRTGAETAHADAIVVLTGAELRIAEGARLLAANHGKRLFITGVHPKVTRADLKRITGLPDAVLECCVDVDTMALDTIGNARETRTWIEKLGYQSLILVTSNFHMPRSKAEFALAMPDVRIVPHAVTPRGFPDQAWWLNPGAARILLSEYLKFLPTAVRLAAMRVAGPWHSSSFASSGNSQPIQARM